MHPNDPKGIDLSNMLHGATVKSVEYNQALRPTYYSDTQIFLQRVVKYSRGYIKDEQQAVYVTFGFIILVVIATLFILFGGGQKNQTVPQSIIDKALPQIRRAQ
jgi:hypothetical protein